MVQQSFLDRLMPPKYDFYGMLKRQADITANALDVFCLWLASPTAANYEKFMRLIYDADAVRMKLEEQLIEAFSTPFDRQDIYTFSVRMDRIIEIAKGTLMAMQDYSVAPDATISALVRDLAVGTRELAVGTALLEKDPKKAEESIDGMRKAYIAVETRYRESMAQLFRSDNAMEAMKLREVYQGIKDSAGFLDQAVDVFHRIIVRLAY